MSDPAPSPPPSADGPAAVNPTKRRQRIVLACVALASMLVGAVAASAAIVVSGRWQPDNRYRVDVYLKNDVTAEQKATLQSALSGVDSVGGVQYQSREQAWKDYQEGIKGRPDLNVVRLDEMPESFYLVVSGTSFDCSVLDPLRDLPGMATIIVVQQARDRGPTATVNCGFF